MANVSSAKTKFLLVESDSSYSTVLSPLKSTQRIKYTCFDVSPSFLVFGATSGGLYIFRREPCTFLQLLPNKEGAVSRVAISPDEKLIAFATVRGIVCVLQRAETSTGTRCLNRSQEHQGSSITAICWVTHSDQVFVGDDQGRLSVINVSLFMSKNMFHIPAFVFMQVDSGVVSICCLGDRLLVSSHTRCYVCDTAKEQYRQVGTKLRDGEYGACYFPSQPIKIYCARPGCRLWEVDEEGVVQSTHQLKHILAQAPVIVVHHSRGIIGPKEDFEWPEQSFNFAQLSLIMDKFLFTFKHDGIYIFDPEKVDVVLWSDCYKDIIDAKCVGDIVYVWNQSQEMHALQVTPLDKCLLRLYFYKHYNLCSELCFRYSSLILQSPEMLSKLGPLLGLKEVLKDSITNELQDFLKHIEIHAKEREFSLRLESGIFLVDNLHARWKLIERSKSMPRNNQRNLKTRSSRSRSLPPNQNRKVRQESPKKVTLSSRKSSASTNSLPELSKSSDLDSIKSDLHYGTRRVSNNSLSQNKQEEHVPQIPFFPLSSPDLIHDALMEIGSSVSEKLVSGTKSLLDRWYKVPQDSSGPFDVSPKQFTEDNQIIQNMAVVEDDVVENQKRRKNNYQNLPNIDISELVALCNNPETEVTIHLLEDVLEKVTNACNLFNELLVSKKSKYMKGIFPFSHYLNKSQFLVITNWFHTSLKNGAILQWLCNQQSNLDNEDTIDHPLVLQDVFSLESLQLDSAFSKVLRLFSEILDPYTILESVDSLGLPCAYLSWCVVIDRFQEGTFRYITKHGDSDNISCADWPLPLLLNAMFLSFRLEQVDSSFRMAISRGVNLKSVSYILLKLTTHLEVTGMTKLDSEHRCNNLLLLYISKMMSKKCEILLNDIGLVSHIESAFIQINAKSNYGTCHCAFPLPGTSVSNAKFSEIGEKLVSYHWEVYRQKIPLNGVKPDLLSHTSRKNDHCVDVSPVGNITFRKFFEETSLINDGSSDDDKKKCFTDQEYLRHIMKICNVSSNLLLWTLKNKAPNDGNNISLVLIVQLGLASEFELYSNCDNEEWWRNVVMMNANVKKGKCCACQTQWPANRKAGFKWTWLSTLILKQLGSQKTINILKEHSKEILPGELDFTFYQACVVTELVDSRAAGLRPKVLDILRRVSDARSQRAVMSPQVGAQIKEALDKDARLISTDNMVSSSNHHWGAEVDLANGDCSLCSLSLGAPRLLHQVGLRVFACSHAFHNVCLRVAHSLLYCPLCTR